MMQIISSFVKNFQFYHFVDNFSIFFTSFHLKASNCVHTIKLKVCVTFYVATQHVMFLGFYIYNEHVPDTENESEKLLRNEARISRINWSNWITCLWSYGRVYIQLEADDCWSTWDSLGVNHGRHIVWIRIYAYMVYSHLKASMYNNYTFINMWDNPNWES